jgi:hypothetical protein
MRLLRLLAFAGIALVVLLAALIGFSETQTFRSMLRDFIVETADSALYANLTIESIDGNLFSGWKLGGVKLTDANGPVAEIESIVLRYNVFRAPWKRITIRELTLNRPRISITRAEGRDWNISTLVRPTEEDSTKTPFDWIITVENVRILDGTLLVYDSARAGPTRRDRLDTGHMLLEKLNLALSATIVPGNYMLSLNQGSFHNRFGEVSLRNIAGDIALRDTAASVEGLSVQTDRTSFLISASAEGADLLGVLDTDALRRMRMSVNLSAPAVDTRDLQYFLPSLDFLGSSAALDVEASGTLDDLRITRLQLDVLESSLEFSGRMRDILEGAEMRIDVSSGNTVIRGADVPLVLPGIPIMDVSGLGTARFSKLSFNGQPLRFAAVVDMESDAGSAAGNITLDVSGEELVYDGALRTEGMDLSKILDNTQLRSDLNLQASIKGSGSKIGRMHAVLRLQADSSRFQRYVANSFTLSADVGSDSLTFDLRTALGASGVAMHGGMSFLPDSITGFRVDADTRNLDLAKIFDDDSLESDLTLSLQATGDGMDLSTTSGDLRIIFSPSRLKNLRIDTDTFHLQVRQRPGEPELLLLESQYADARLTGRFDLPRFADYLVRQLDSLSAALDAFALSPDSSALAIGEAQRGDARQRGDVRQRGRASPSNGARAAARGARSDRGSVAATRTGTAVSEDTAAFMDVRYSLTLKNPDRIARFFDASTFLVRGTWQGSITGGLNGFDIGGEIALSDFYYVDSTRTWLAAGLRCTYDMRNLRLERPLEQLQMNTRLSVADMYVDGLRLSRTQLQLDWTENTPALRVRSMIDTLIQLDLQADARYAQHGFDVSVSRLQLIYRGVSWENRSAINLRFDTTGLVVRQFDLANDGNSVALTGKRSSEGMNDFTIYADSLDIAALQYMISGDTTALEGQGFGGTGFVEAQVSGSDAAPLLAANVFIDSLSYRGAHFGKVELEARYNDRMLEVYSELTYETSKGKDEKVFFVSGSVPVALDGSEEIADGSSASLRLQMREFPLTLTEEFIGLFSPLSGTASADITITGTAEDPSFNGYLTLSDARGRFVFNNMEYDLGLRVEAIERDIRIMELSIANQPGDWRDGRMTATGSVSTEAFSVNEFDLSVNGRLKVLKFASRSALRAIYGDLYISTGDQGLSYRGRLDRSMLLGEIIVEQGNLIFPLELSEGAVNKYADITYVVVDDTTKQRTSSLSASRFDRLSAASPKEQDDAPRPGRSMLDGLTFDLTLRTSGRLRLEIPFSLLQEELNAQIDLNNLKVNNWGGSGMKFVGEVMLGPDSYYIFLGKRMTATGSLRFTRDPMNPDLDLTAVYSDFYVDPRTQVRRAVFVTVRITGTKSAPQLAYDMRWDEKDGEPITSAGEVQSDAFSFLLFGMFTKDIGSGGGDRSTLMDKSQELLTQQVTSSLASSAATEFLSRAGLQDYIKRVDFAGLGSEESRVKLTSEIGRAIISYDGKINDLESSNVSVDFPLSRVLGIPWTNLLVQISRKTLNESYESTTQSQEYSVWELKILQRFAF